MGRATLARQKANGHIGQHRTDKLYDAGLIVIEAAEYEKLTARVAELEKALAHHKRGSNETVQSVQG